MWNALLHAAVFFAATAWAFQLGQQVAGAWLGMLMGLNAGIFAVMMLSGLQSRLSKAQRTQNR